MKLPSRHAMHTELKYCWRPSTVTCQPKTKSLDHVIEFKGKIPLPWQRQVDDLPPGGHTWQVRQPVFPFLCWLIRWRHSHFGRYLKTSTQNFIKRPTGGRNVKSFDYANVTMRLSPGPGVGRVLLSPSLDPIAFISRASRVSPPVRLSNSSHFNWIKFNSIPIQHDCHHLSRVRLPFNF